MAMMLCSEGDVYSTPALCKAQGSLWKRRRQRDFRSLKLWETAEKRCFLDIQGHCTCEHIAVAAACPRSSPPTKHLHHKPGRGSRVLTLAEEPSSPGKWPLVSYPCSSGWPSRTDMVTVPTGLSEINKNEQRRKEDPWALRGAGEGVGQIHVWYLENKLKFYFWKVS